MHPEEDVIDAGQYGSAASYYGSLAGKHLQVHTQGTGYDFHWIYYKDGFNEKSGYTVIEDNRTTPAGNITFVDNKGQVGKGTAARFNVVERLPQLP